MTSLKQRIAIDFCGGYVPGLNFVLAGAVLAAGELGWDVVGIRDGFDGLLHPERYPRGWLIELSKQTMENFSGPCGTILGTASRTDPFHVRTINPENQVEELDRSGEILEMLGKEGIEAVISVVDARALSIAWKLHRKGLNVVCVPQSVENDVAGTMLSFGFNSALSFVSDMLDRCRQAAQSAQKIGIVEVLGEHAGWLALQAGMSVCADAVLIPEIPYDLRKVATKLRDKAGTQRASGLVVVAEGAKSVANLKSAPRISDAGMKAALSPGATGDEGQHVIEGSGRVAAEVALEIQKLTDQETYPLVIGQLAKGGQPTVVDRQLGLGYGAGAVRAIESDHSGVMVVFQPPDLRFIPLAEALNRFRTVSLDCELVQIVRALGISLGD